MQSKHIFFISTSKKRIKYDGFMCSPHGFTNNLRVKGYLSLVHLNAPLKLHGMYLLLLHFSWSLVCNASVMFSRNCKCDGRDIANERVIR